MMIQTKFLIFSSMLLLTSISTISLAAGQLYRFPDENGTLTLSTTLPATAAQKGYDVLDATSMRLIERIPPALSEEELLEQATQQKLEAEAKKKAELEAEKVAQANQTQRVYDKTLLTTYRTEQDLIDARDTDIAYRQEQIDIHQKKLPDLKQHLYDVQKQAAERELSGAKITANMQKRLTAAEEEIVIRKQAIADLKQDIEQLTTRYQSDLDRLRFLLKGR